MSSVKVKQDKEKEQNMPKTHELGPDIFSDLHEELNQGNSYASALLATGYSGRMFTYLPLDIHPYKYNLSKLVDFTKTSHISSDGKKAIYDHVHTFLHTDKKRIVLIETYYFPNDVSKLQKIPRVVYSGHEVFYFLNNRDKYSSIISGFRSARIYPFICGLIDLEKDSQEIHEQQEIPTELWAKIASNTRAVVIGAYDAVGYLMWEKTL